MVSGQSGEYVYRKEGRPGIALGDISMRNVNAETVQCIQGQGRSEH